MVEPAFSPKYVESLRPTIQKIVDDCLHNMLKQKPPVDLITSFSMPVPYLVRLFNPLVGVVAHENIQTIAKILGIPQEDTDALIKNTAVRSNGSSTARQAAQASKDLVDYMEQLVKRKEEKPGDDLISKLVTEQACCFQKVDGRGL